MEKLNAELLIELLNERKSPERKKTNEWFFKTGKGEYGEGDVFIGLSNPDVREITKLFMKMEFGEIEKLLKDKIHEIRFAGLIILTENASKAFAKKDAKRLKEITDFYLHHKSAANNWDLVDLSCYKILGNAILLGIYDLDILDRLSESTVLWDRRIAMVSTFALIKKKKIYPSLTLAKKLLDNKEDLMHKAVGWMLREAWKVDNNTVEEFILENYSSIPRTALRYAIEKMDESKRQDFLKWQG
jgi:3-methyladenine DNA glycosylase AlkD